MALGRMQICVIISKIILAQRPHHGAAAPGATHEGPPTALATQKPRAAARQGCWLWSSWTMNEGFGLKGFFFAFFDVFEYKLGLLPMVKFIKVSVTFDRLSYKKVARCIQLALSMRSLCT